MNEPAVTSAGASSQVSDGALLRGQEAVTTILPDGVPDEERELTDTSNVATRTQTNRSSRAARSAPRLGLDSHTKPTPQSLVSRKVDNDKKTYKSALKGGPTRLCKFLLRSARSNEACLDWATLASRDLARSCFASALLLLLQYRAVLLLEEAEEAEGESVSGKRSRTTTASSL